MKSQAAEVLFNGQVAGILRQTGQQYSFRYDKAYLQTDQPAISLTLPKRPEAFVSPAYDLLNTSLHVNDGNGLALGLFADDYETPNFAAKAFLAYDDFLEFGRRIGLPPSRVRRVLAEMAGHEAATDKLLRRSLLAPAMQAAYAASLAARRQRLRYSLGGSS